MKAVYFDAHGTDSALTFGELGTPEPKGNEVLVKLEYAALNHLDIWVRNGSPAYSVALPHVLGSDGSGIVEDLGPDAEGISIGSRVCLFPALSCGQCSFCRQRNETRCDHFEILGAKRWGTYAEFVVVPDQNVIEIPPTFPLEVAAAFPLAYLTSWHMLMGRAKLQPQETLLVIGAGGGIGPAAIQIASNLKAKVLAQTTDEKKVDSLLKLGASEVVVTKENISVSKWVHEKTGGRGVDVVFEHVGPATWTESIKSLCRGGRLVTCGATTGPTVELDLRYAFSRELSILGSRMGTPAEFQAIAEKIFSQQIKPVIDQTFPLSEAAAAQRHLESRSQFGKVLLKI